MISISGEKFAREGVIEPMQGMWISTFILLPIGIFLMYKATSDSALFNIESYTSIITKIFKKNKVK